MNSSTLAKYSLVVLTAITLLLAVLTFREGISLKTDLNSLAPQLSLPPVVNKALEKSTQQNSNNITVLLSSNNLEEIENASDALIDAVELDEKLNFVDHSEVFERYSDLLLQHPFGLLTENARQRLAAEKDDEIINFASQSIFGMSSYFRFTDLENDPFGLVNEWINQALSPLTSNEDIIQRHINNEVRYFSLHQLRISGKAFQLDGEFSATGSVRTLLSNLEGEFDSLASYASGVSFFAEGSANAAKREISLISTISLAGIIILMLAVFGRPSALLLPIIMIGSGSAVAFTLCHAFFGSLHIFTIVFGVSLMGVAIDYAIHWYYGFQKSNSSNNSHLTKALFFSVLTSSLGYLSLSFSGLSTLKQVAFFSATGLLTASLVVLALGPTIAKINIKPRDAYLKKSIQALLRGARFIKPHYFTLTIIALFLILFVFNGMKIPSNDSPKALYYAPPELLAKEQKIRSVDQQFEKSTFLLIQATSSEQLFETINAVDAELDNLGINSFGIQKLIPSITQQQLNYELGERLYKSEGVLSSFVEQLGLELNQVEIQTQYRSASNQFITPEMLMTHLGDDFPPVWFSDENQQFSFLLLPQNAPLDKVFTIASYYDNAQLVSAVSAAENALQHLRENALILLLVAITLIAAILKTRFSWQQITQAMAIPCTAILATLSIFIVFNIEMTLFHSMALFLVLGLGMDYVIFTQELPKQIIKTQCAISLSAITSLLSFGLLSASATPSISGFGLTVLIGNGINLFACYFLASQTFSSKENLDAN